MKVWYLHKRYGRKHYAVAVTKGRRPNLAQIEACKTRRDVGTGRNLTEALSALSNQIKVNAEDMIVVAL